MAHTPTTAAGVVYNGFEGFDPDDHDFMLWIVSVKVNGPAPDIQTQVRFFRNASAAEKQAAVRLIVNNHLSAYEPGVTLNNANIQISGQPI